MKKSIAVLGLGKYGTSIALELARSGAEVLAVDLKEERIKEVADEVTYAVRADVCDAEAIKALGIGNMDAVIIAMTSNLDACIMSTIVAKELNVPLVIVKCRDKLHEQILKKIGADKVVIPEKESASRLAKNLMSGNFVDFMELSDDVSIAEISAKPEWIGKTLDQLDFRQKYGANVFAIRTGEKMQTDVDPYRPIAKGSTLFVLAETKNIKKLM